MPNAIRVAVLGLTHDHVWSNIPNLLKSDQVRLVAVADANRPLLDRATERWPDLATFTDSATCLDQMDPEVVLVCDTNAQSVELVVQAAAAGCNCVVEKPIANSLAGADRMLAAVDEAGVKLIVNWPTAWTPSFWQAAWLALGGEYGPIWQCRFHSAHNGPKEIGCSEYFWRWLYDFDQNGPGAMADYCCYGAVTCRWLQGMPEQVVGFAGKFVKTYDVPNDNAVVMLRYSNAISLLEASWTQVGNVPRKGLTINCVAGTLVPTRDGLLLADDTCPEGRKIAGPPLPRHLDNLGAYVNHIVREGGQPEGILDPMISRDAQAILDAGYRSAVQGTIERP